MLAVLPSTAMIRVLLVVLAMVVTPQWVQADLTTQFPAMVRSGGHADGSFAEFYAAGERFNVTASRGFTVVTLAGNGSLLDAQTFGTHQAAGASAMIEFVNNISNGTFVMIAVKEDAYDGLDSDVKDAIRSCGGESIDELTYRGSYALLGHKGGVALAEKVLGEGSGFAAAASVYGSGGVPGVNITVQSAAYADGNFAKFFLNGDQLGMPTARGWNAVFLAPDGAVLGSHVFDTYQNGSAELVAAIDALEVGSPVLFAVKDDARYHLSDEAQAALTSCGATHMQDFHWRYSYAFVGMKGAGALAEAESAPGQGSVSVSARYGGPIGSFLDRLPTVTTTTMTTTTLAPVCGFYECSTPGLVHRADAAQLPGSGDDTCCEEAAPGIVSAVVRSAGYGNGNVAEFYLDGQKLHVSTHRGINVLPLRADGTPKKVESFDTFKAGSEDLVAFLDALPAGTRVLIASRDEATRNFTDAARAAVKTCGGSLIGNLTYRGAYALIGEKGGAAFAEQVLPDGAGYAMASAHLQIEADSSAASKPRCPARTAYPPVSGWMSNGQFELDEGCRYSLFESDGAAKCLSGSWMVVIGGSNTVLMTIRLANMLAPEAIQPVRDGATMGGFTVVDVIIDGGSKVYGVARKLEGCSALRQDAACKAAIAALVAEAPAPAEGATRITLFSAQFWDHALTAMETVEASGGSWLNTQMAFLLQVSTWDIYCAGMKVSWCPRKDLNVESLSSEDALAQFKAGMDPVLAKLEDFCAPEQPAGQLGCVVGTTTFQNPAKSRIPIYEAYNDAIRQAVAPKASDTLRLVDFWVMGQAMPEENILGHGSPALNLWNWQVMLSGMCPEKFAAEGTSATFEGELCFGAEAKRNAESMSKCPAYRDACPENGGDHIRCEPWECANSLPCTLVASVSDGPEPDTDGFCDEEVLPDFASAAAADKEAPCGHLWCVEQWQWQLLPAMVAAAFALFLLLLPRLPLARLLPKRLQRSPKEPSARITAADGRREGQPKDEKAAAAGKASDAAAVGVGEGEKASGPKLENSGSGSTGPSESSGALSETVISIDDGSSGGGNAPGASAKNNAAESGSCSEGNAPISAVVPSREQPQEEEAVGNVEQLKSDEIVGAAPIASAGTAFIASASADAVTSTQTSIGAKADMAKAEQKKAPVARRKAGDKFPLGLARFCASLHVVVGHLYAKGVTPSVYFFGWGFTWVPWFFMLSGFVLFTAHLRRPKQEGILEYVMRRSVSIYPLYAFSLLPAIALAKYADKVPSISVLVAQSFLVQAWWPAWTEHALQSHCWFLSAMVVYWLLFRPLSRCLQNLNLVATVACMLTLFFLPWLVVLVPIWAHEPVVWYKQHSWGETATLLDLEVVFLKFHPACYLHVFVLGMLLAKLRLLLDARATAAARPRLYCLPMEFLAPLGYLGLGLVFCLPSLQPLAYKLSARLSVLLPLQAAVLLGLAGLPSMPISRVADLASRFNFLENYSYAVYVFQFICYSVWPATGEVNLPLFLVFCVSFAVIIAILVQKHVQSWWGKHPRARMGVPFVLSALLVGVALLPSVDQNPDLPALLRQDARMIDVRLQIVDSEGSSEMGHLMNPSIGLHDGQVLVAARRHTMEESRRNGWYNGSAATVVDQTWRSQILLGSAPLDVEAWARWPTSGEAPFAAEITPWYWLRNEDGDRWSHLCVPEVYDDTNNTLLRHVVTGPEDAKIFFFNGSTNVAFNSLPPLGEDRCAEGEDVSQMYLASDVHVMGAANDVGHRLTCGETDLAEKNWIPFTHAGKLHFVYSPLPHTVVTAQPGGECEEAYTSDFAPLQRLKRANPSLVIRGSGQAVFINDTEATPSLPRPHYLATLHMKENDRSEAYAHFAYRFSAEPPFNILQVSSQLPLLAARPIEKSGAAFAFVSGLAVVNRTVAITYGAGDRDSRALVMTLDRLDEFFSCEDSLSSSVEGSSNTTAANVSTGNASLDAGGNTSNAENSSLGSGA